MEQEFCQFSGKLKIKCGNFPIKSNLSFFLAIGHMNILGQSRFVVLVTEILNLVNLK